MSIYNRLQKFFGFSYEDDNNEFPEFSDESSNQDEAMQFNESQKKFIYQVLDGTLKEYLNELLESKAPQNNNGDNSKLKTLLAETKEKLKTTEEHLTKETDKALSQERQKRALLSQINDLKAKIAQLQAEQEQYELENKALQNKLRVAEVHRGDDMADINSIREKLATVTAERDNALAQLTAARDSATPDLTNITAERDKAMAELAKVMDELNAAKAERDKALAEVNTTTERLAGVIAERDKAVADKAKVTEELNGLKTERDKAVADCIKALEESRELRNRIEDLNIRFVPLSDTTPAQPQKQTSNQQEPKGTQVPANDTIEVFPGYEFVTFDETPKTTEAEVKPEPQKAKKSRNNTDDILNDTDWLVEASEAYENPDLVVPPSHRLL